MWVRLIGAKSPRHRWFAHVAWRNASVGLHVQWLTGSNVVCARERSVSFFRSGKSSIPAS